MTLNTKMAPRIGKLIRGFLRRIGVVLYHLGLSKWIVGLSPQRVRALLYHSVEESPGSYTAGLNVNVTPQTFAMHMDYAQRHYSVTTIEQTIDGSCGPCPSVITFDDGYASVEEHAVPVLEQRGLPATIYLISSAVNGATVWVNQLNHALNCHKQTSRAVIQSYPTLANLDHAEVIHRVQTTFSPDDIEILLEKLFSTADCASEDRSALRLLFSTADDVIAMQKRGMYFGFHTHDHYNLKRCNDEQLTRQLDRSSVAHLLNSNTFAYPFGYFSAEATRKLTKQGYDQLMTVGSGTRALSKLHQGRSEVFATTPAAVFAQLEVEEPVMDILRQSIQQTCVFFKGSGLGAVGLSSSPSHGQSSLPLKNDIPETSKPR